MAITAPKRSSELGILDLNFSKKYPEGISLSLPGMTKISSEVHTVFFASFLTANAICVTTSLDAYLNRTAQAKETSVLSDRVPKSTISILSLTLQTSQTLLYCHNPEQNIGDTFPNTVIFLAHCYYIEQTSPIPPPINVVFISYRFNIVLGVRG